MSLTILEGEGSDSGLTQSLTQVRKNLTQIFNGTYNEASRNRLADQVNDTIEHVLSMANTKHNQSYLFGGSNTSQQPYVAEKEDGVITSVEYKGSKNARQIKVAPGVEESVFTPGSEIFQSEDRGEPKRLTEQTGITLGSGTSSVNGFTWVNSEYNDSTGRYELYLDDPSKKVEIDPAEDNTNVALTNSEGRVLYVNAEGVSSEGKELVNTEGTNDIFDTLITIRDIFKNKQNLETQEVVGLAEKSVDALNEVNNKILNSTTSIGMKVNFLDDLKNNLEDMQMNVDEQTTNLQEADVSEIAIDLSRRQTLYQMSLSVASRMMSTSLLDYI
jgi:flagellar hook-associated protein 3 FlgL